MEAASLQVASAVAVYPELVDGHPVRSAFMASGKIIIFNLTMTISPIFFAFILFGYTSCKSPAKNDTIIWKSKYRQLTMKVYQPWKLVPGSDTKEKTKTAILDMNDGKSYIVQLMKDVPFDSLSNHEYYEQARSQMLQPDEKNRLLAENDTLFHGHSFHQMIFLMYTKKWGLLKMISLIRRTEFECCTVQISFPVPEEGAEKKDIPSSLREFDKHIRINGH